MRHWLSALVLALSWASVCAADSSLEGQWVGGFHQGQRVVSVTLSIASSTSGLSGAMNVPQQDAWRLPLQRIELRGDRVRFELQAGRDTAVFDGHLVGDGRMQGTVRQGPAHVSRFELLKLAPLTPTDIRGITGTYTWDGDHVLLIAPSGDGVVYVDYESGRTGDLRALSRTRLVGGRTGGTPYPIDIDLTFTRNDQGVATTVTLTRDGRTIEARRATFYLEEEMAIPSDDAIISGTLLRPVGRRPHPALVMVHGSGPVTRDALRRSADHFARHGVAVLITDKRGTGRSTGSWQRATFDDLAADALASVEALRSRDDIDPGAVGLHGVSFGSWVAPLAASRSANVAFVVVESAPTVTPMAHERLRVEAQLRADGFSRKDIVQALALMDQKFEVARSGRGWSALEETMRAAADAAWLPYANPPTSLAALQWDWEHIFEFDPMPALSRLEVPVLALYGGRDTIVPARVHQARMAGALRAGRRTDVTVDVFETANHGFLEAVTGGRREATQLTSFVDGYFEQRTAWVLDAVRSVASGAAVARVRTRP